MINLISDTVTKPCKNMLKAMVEAQVGHDVFGDDPTVNELQSKMAEMFNKEAALFCPSGTMTNQLAIKIHTQPLDEIICDHFSHVYQYETGGYAFNSGVAVNLIEGRFGKIKAEQIEDAIKEDHDWLPNSRLVVIENSCNKGGGSYYTFTEMSAISSICKSRNLKLHLDGARLFNVLVETGDSTHKIGDLFDSISICLSKGLGAPVGSILIGSKEDIKKARRFRKVMGGGMRQAGYLAAAGLFALENNIDRLKIDNNRAREIGQLLSNMPYIKSVRPVMTNIVIFELNEDVYVNKMLHYLEEVDILATVFGPKAIRLVFHLDIDESMLEPIKKAILNFNP